ncbi:MAG: class I SAM-dependent methyltransferase [Pelagibacteraceae bacterium]|jgi:hypothetical protein|nr:class I SAM-dependent methyltransferase [Pelagibacteraceae bacterium]MBO6470598.1 class I SAM-dependent methyltransferase [Pelagibacteraceae bacterium]MBO6471148.1 class I SAM-dependent methyltransferase [Pelagibacteraceae bacterium]HJO76406.1 TylF/MycF/NovP-related O-methyltransferase [Pelagibacteraceae bacterium]
MSLEKNIKIIFENIKLENNIDFFKLWKETYKIVNPSKSLDLNNMLTAIRINKSFYLCKYFIFAKDLKGDFLECGVLKGFSSYLLRSLEDQLFKDTINNYFLIDSFEGLSDFLDEDKSLNPDIIQNKKGDLKANIEDVKVLFNQFKNVNIIKGWIPKVFESLDEKNKYKFVHIDVDLYQPTFDSLNYIYDKIVEGGILITDDYRSPSFPGNQKAWEKYFNSKNIRSLSLPSGQAVVIKE